MKLREPVSIVLAVVGVSVAIYSVFWQDNAKTCRAHQVELTQADGKTIERRTCVEWEGV